MYGGAIGARSRTRPPSRPLYIILGSVAIRFTRPDRCPHKCAPFELLCFLPLGSRGCVGSGIEIPHPPPMGSRWGRGRYRAPSSMRARLGRDHDPAPVAHPLYHLGFRCVQGLLDSTAVPISAHQARYYAFWVWGRGGAGVRPRPLHPGVAMGVGSRTRLHLPWGRDGGEIKIPTPSRPLYIVLAPAAFRFLDSADVTISAHQAGYLAIWGWGARASIEGSGSRPLPVWDSVRSGIAPRPLYP